MLKNRKFLLKNVLAFFFFRHKTLNCLQIFPKCFKYVPKVKMAMVDRRYSSFLAAINTFFLIAKELLMFLTGESFEFYSE